MSRNTLRICTPLALVVVSMLAGCHPPLGGGSMLFSEMERGYAIVLPLPRPTLVCNQPSALDAAMREDRDRPLVAVHRKLRMSVLGSLDLGAVAVLDADYRAHGVAFLIGPEEVRPTGERDVGRPAQRVPRFLTRDYVREMSRLRTPRARARAIAVVVRGSTNAQLTSGQQPNWRQFFDSFGLARGSSRALEMTRPASVTMLFYDFTSVPDGAGEYRYVPAPDVLNKSIVRPYGLGDCQ